jgi:hypothetical protein
VAASYEIDRRRRLVVSRAWDVLTDEELIDHYVSLRRDPAFDPRYRQLIELREVRRFDTAVVTVEAAARLRVFAPEVRRAIVAPDDEAFERARRFAAFAGLQAQRVEVFRTERAAMAWLDGDADGVPTHGAVMWLTKGAGSIAAGAVTRRLVAAVSPVAARGEAATDAPSVV